jgi:hypothetical protein
VFEDRVLRRIFGCKMDEVTRERNKLHSEEPHNLYSSPNVVWQIKSRRMRWVGHVSDMAEEIKVYMAFVGKPKGKTPLGRPRCRWEDGIKIDLREIGWVVCVCVCVRVYSAVQCSAVQVVIEISGKIF